jgi:hypothetical protein
MTKRNGPIPLPPAARFWKHVAVAEPDACWEWTGAKYPPPNAYGFMSAGVFYGAKKFVKAHRVSWEIANGPVPDGLNILHKCDNQGCVNPAHLYAGTQQQNVRDRAVRRRGKEHRQNGSANDNAKLTDAQIVAVRELRKAGQSQMDISRMFGMSQSQISKILNGKAWAHLPEVE